MKGTRTLKSYTMRLSGKPEAIFPLLCPVREYEWIEPWECEMVYTESGFAEQDCIFKTNFPDDGPEDIWVVSRYEPPHLIEFVRVNGIRAIRYTISLRAKDDGTTSAEWKQVTTGLTPKGNEFVQKADDTLYQKKMKGIEMILNHFLTAGEMFKLSVHGKI